MASGASAQAMVSQGYRPCADDYNNLLFACSAVPAVSGGGLQRAEQVAEAMAAAGLAADSATFTALIAACHRSMQVCVERGGRQRHGQRRRARQTRLER